MMKNTQRTLVRRIVSVRTLGIAALIAVIGFSMAGCAQMSSLLLPPSIEGVWKSDNGHTVDISGSTGTFVVISSDGSWTSAVEKGFVKIGDLKFRNIKSSGDLKWSGEQLMVTYNTSTFVASSTKWERCTFTLNKDGRTLTAGNTIYKRQ